MTTRTEDVEIEIAGDDAGHKKNPPDLNRWLAGAAAVLAVTTVALAVLLFTGGDDDVNAIEAAGFPTGTFQSEDGSIQMIFNDNGTCRISGGSWVVPCTYAVSDELYTETTFEAPRGVQAPATFYWTFDGELLTFELWGDDVRPARQQVYTSHDYVRIG